MNARWRGLVAMGCLTTMLSGACAGSGTSSPAVTSPQARSAEVPGDTGTRTDGGTSTNESSGGTRSSSASSTEKARSSAASSSGSAGGDATDPIALGSAETIDDDSDRTGAGPGYTEITRAAVDGGGDVVTFTLEVGEPFPKRLPKDSNLILGIGVQEDAEHPAVALIAQGTAAGWTAAIQDDEGSRPIDDWSLEGDTISWTVPWELLEGPRAFEWGASLQLFDFSTEAGTASDKAPNGGPQAFPTD